MRKAQPVSIPTALPERLLPGIQFPNYAYVPGRFPHPSRNRQSHGAGLTGSQAERLDERQWHRNPFYLYGIDLFNHGYYWEAHEAWESLWHLAGRHGRVADLLKALIAIAAAGVKAREGNSAGVRRHADRATSLLNNLLTGTDRENARFLGHDLPTLQTLTMKLAISAEQILNESAACVVIVVPFSIVPETTAESGS